MNKKFFIALLVIAISLALVSFWSYRDISAPKVVSKVYTIGILYQGSGFEKVTDGFRGGMDEAASKYGTAKYIIKKVEGTTQQSFDDAAQELVDQRVDLIFAVALEPILAARKVTIGNQIPVVFALGYNPTLFGVVESLQKTGNNLTGMTWLAWELSGKRLELLKMIDPSIKRVMVVGRKEGKTIAKSIEFMKPVADKFGIAISAKEIPSTADYDMEVRKITRKDTDAVYYAPDPILARKAKLFINHSLDEKLPTIFVDEYFTREGGLASYGGNYESSGKQASRIAGKILFQGQRPQDLPVESVEDIDFIINMTSAKKMGLTISSEVVDLAGVVIVE